MKPIIQRISSFFKPANKPTWNDDVTEKLNKIMKTLQELLDDVKDERTKIGSLITLTNGIKKQLDEILSGALTPEQQAKVDAVFAEVEAGKADVQAAIDANTTPPVSNN